jgi:uncharacterized membrane protein YeaQ/YmgE (transglycosylase-associated protein family)
MLLTILIWIVFGAIVGAIARLLIPGRQPMGFLLTMVLGIVGSLLGGFISWLFTGGPDDPYAPGGWIMSILGALIVLGIYVYTQRSRTV